MDRLLLASREVREHRNQPAGGDVLQPYGRPSTEAPPSETCSIWQTK
ncbi:hypothetical protein CEV34_2237 [Brucella pseudogrignonensis]|uniref:Uncharacterized protein n=1 Tax=Brucella pseudogrignonensis TaxID=419475 RepID=A0A256GHU0_9HYPH|nr:hypothetical protein CEV34_2237 [Brucella pseudogrignonensis]